MRNQAKFKSNCYFLNLQSGVLHYFGYFTPWLTNFTLIGVKLKIYEVFCILNVY